MDDAALSDGGGLEQSLRCRAIGHEGVHVAGAHRHEAAEEIYVVLSGLFLIIALAGHP